MADRFTTCIGRMAYARDIHGPHVGRRTGPSKRPAEIVAGRSVPRPPISAGHLLDTPRSRRSWTVLEDDS